MAIKILTKPAAVLLIIGLLIIAALLSCQQSTENVPGEPEFKLVAVYNLSIRQPSGVTFDANYELLWIADGDQQRIFKTDLKGNVISKLNYIGNDIEGVAFDRRDSTLWIVEEKTREVVHIDAAGNLIEKKKLNISGIDNNGLEGICLDGENNIYVINEKSPVALFPVNKDFSVGKKIDIDFAKDITYISYVSNSKNFFITSDESKALYIWKLKEGIQKKLDLPFTKTEGVAVNPVLNRIVLVNDSLNTLSEYSLK